MGTVAPIIHLCRVGAALRVDLGRFLGASLRSRTALAAKNRFLRKQLALYPERRVNPQRASDPIRLALVLLARCFAWREALTVMQPATLIRLRPANMSRPRHAASLSRTYSLFVEKLGQAETDRGMSSSIGVALSGANATDLEVMAKAQSETFLREFEKGLDNSNAILYLGIHFSMLMVARDGHQGAFAGDSEARNLLN